jgi:hypothetical protein
VEFSLGVVQFSGHASWIWYSHVPLLALQNPMFGRTFVGNSVITGVNSHAPIELMMLVVVYNLCFYFLALGIFSVPQLTGRLYPLLRRVGRTKLKSRAREQVQAP